MATCTSNTSNILCSICTEQFKNPKILSCFHTFCLDCLQQLASSSSKDGQFECPMCRYLVTLPKGGVAAFQTNLYIEARAEKERHGVGECCGVCEQSASHTCSECEMLLCDTCTKCHATLPSTRSHVLINLGDSHSEKPLLSIQKFCEKHKDEKLRFYCNVCVKVICLHCKLTEHEGHKTKDICDVAEEARAGLTKTQVKLETYKAEIDETREHVNRDTMEMLQTIDKTKTQVNQFADSVLELINNARCYQITGLTDVEEMKKKTFSHQQEILSQRKCFIQSQIDHCDVMLREGLDCDLITTDGKMKQRLAQIEKEQNTRSDSDSTPEYFPPNPSANPGQLEVVRCAVNDVMMNAFSASEKNVLFQEIKTIRYGTNIQCISFTKSQKVYLLRYFSFLSTGYKLCLYERSSTESTWKLDVTMDELRKNGVHGVVDKHKKHPHKNISEDDYTDLKKPFPYMDINDDGDKCSVVDDYNVVFIKPVNGVARFVTFNPFAEPGEEFKPIDVCWGSNQEIYIADRGTDTIVVYSLRDGFQKSFQSPSRPTCRITALTMDTEGKLWVANGMGYVYICNVD